jgi:hypothetical protein
MSGGNMPRYYFDLIEGDEVIPDEEGLELSSIEKVREEASAILGRYGSGHDPADLRQDQPHFGCRSP